MSSQSVIHPVEQSKLTVVQFPALQAITQLELAVLLSLRGRLSQLEEQVEAAEQSIKARLETGAALESGDHRAELKENFRRNVSWKDVVVRLAERLKMDGEAYCAKVLSSTKPTRSVSLVVE
jgi:predicted phage gp36 major capsid-like protein